MTQTTNVDTVVTQLAESYKQWVFGAGRTGPLIPQNVFSEGAEHLYNLKGTGERKFLQWESQQFGINIGWTDDASSETARRVSRWFFGRRGGGSGPVRFGESIAIGYGTVPSFLRYEDRTFGINLRWVAEPPYEWTVLGGVSGSPVNRGDRVALHNAKAGTAQVPGVLLSFDRTVGADLGWPDSKTWWDQVKDKVPGLAKDALAALIMAKLRGA
jgi:hypothetical protein